VQVKRENLKAPAIGLEPITCRLTGGLSRREPAGAKNVVSLLHLHKGLSEANKAMLAAVSPCAA